MNFISALSNLTQDFSGTLRSIFADCFWTTIFSTKKSFRFLWLWWTTIDSYIRLHLANYRNLFISNFDQLK